jgi:hypothetical protein
VPVIGYKQGIGGTGSNKENATIDHLVDRLIRRRRFGDGDVQHGVAAAHPVGASHIANNMLLQLTMEQHRMCCAVGPHCEIDVAVQVRAFVVNIASAGGIIEGSRYAMPVGVRGEGFRRRHISSVSTSCRDSEMNRDGERSVALARPA